MHFCNTCKLPLNVYYLTTRTGTTWQQILLQNLEGTAARSSKLFLLSNCAKCNETGGFFKQSQSERPYEKVLTCFDYRTVVLSILRKLFKMPKINARFAVDDARVVLQMHSNVNFDFAHSILAESVQRHIMLSKHFHAWIHFCCIQFSRFMSENP